MMYRANVVGLVALGLLACVLPAQAADPWADVVLEYAPGETVGDGAFQSGGGLQALGAPARESASGPFSSQVGVFSGPFSPEQLVSIGPSGHLTLAFDEPVVDDPRNPFGIDLLVFGNAFYLRDDQGRASALFGEQGTIEVSQDNVTWHTVPDVVADGPFPTLGYTDTMFDPETFANVGGTTPTDFTLPVDPTFDPLGLTEAEIMAGYAGSGGGAGVDLATVGLDSIRYVRILGAEGGIEIDAVADVRPVPEPATASLAVAGTAALLAAGRWRRP